MQASAVSASAAVLPVAAMARIPRTRGFKTYFGRNNEPGPSLSDADFPAGEKSNNWENFIQCVRSRKVEDLDCDIAEGHLSASIGHLGVISYRTGHKLEFDPEEEKFVNDPEADKLLTREYRKPYVMPDI